MNFFDLQATELPRPRSFNRRLSASSLSFAEVKNQFANRENKIYDLIFFSATSLSKTVSKWAADGKIAYSPIFKSNMQDMARDAIVSISASGIKNILSNTIDFVT